MPTGREVRGDLLVKELAKYLFENYKDKIIIPKWVYFIRTRPGNERNPDDPPDVSYDGSPGWFYYRMASVLRYVYLKGPIGLSRLRKLYGGKVKRGLVPPRYRRGYGKLHRYILQTLENLGLVTKINEGKRKGRAVTPLGQSIIDKLANKIYVEHIKNEGTLIEQIEKLKE